ncbi:MAG TPA: SurA N-terminal domain-containing protein [Candidatus Acidoferrales bacterium]|nr:SurA N-terminal domain-containing protein [Candidatus Acidoferrales bacterium]
MKPRLLMLAALLVCAVAASCRREAAPGPGVWAVVNGTDIARAEVEKNFRSRLTPDTPPPSHEEALSLKLTVLEELINSEILLQRAAKMNLVASDAEVEDKFTQSKSPFTEEEFQRKLQESGLTIDDLKSNIRRQISIQKLLNREVVAKISVTDRDIADFYNQNKSQFDLPEPQYHVSEIVITPHPDPTVHNRKNDKAANEAEAGRKAAMLAQKLSAGADFTQLAMDYSEDSTASTGGDLGFNPESSFNRSDPLLKRSVLSMKVGEVSQPLLLKDGRYVILKLLGKESAGQRELSDPQVREGIRQMLRSRKEQLLRAAYLAQARDESHVTNYLAREILESAGQLPAD